MIDLDYFRQDLKLDIRKGSSSLYLKDFLNENYNVSFDFDVYLPSKGKNLQRPLVWDLGQKRELILSVLKDIKIPSISIIIWRDDIGKDGGKMGNHQIYKVIDGKQRITTLLDFYQNKFSLIVEGQHLFYQDLGPEAQRVIKLFTFTQDIVYEYESDKMVSDDDKIKWFELINFSGTPQDKDHLENLKSDKPALPVEESWAENSVGNIFYDLFEEGIFDSQDHMEKTLEKMKPYLTETILLNYNDRNL